MRLATIGTSAITLSLLTASNHVTGVEHGAVVSRDAQRGRDFAQQAAAITATTPHVVTDLGEVAASGGIDAVYVASPNAVHHRQVRELLEGGKHVLVEKSATSNRAQFADLLTVAQQHGVVLMEAMRSVHDPGFTKIKHLLPNLGALRRAEFRLCQYSSRYQRFLDGETPAIFDPNLSAGALMDIGTYCAHPAAALWGEPARVHAEATILRSGADGAGTVVCGYDSPTGLAVSLHYSKITTSRLPSTIEGELATLEIDSITTPRHLSVIGTDGSHEDITVDGLGGGSSAPENMSYELAEFTRLASAQEEQRDHQALHRHQQATLDTLAILDRTRQILGVHFPDDPWSVNGL
ncbi:Gfo/Idh/MocA family protein [Kocuria sp.]|uniref:Gfo/Idh/MocA family protein n=1 Tax=Kocuria sp. TaxID=1871328 RepID=UPI0026E0F985|nr:Gfo/Idh/MocA family oxidoreductase [Kocuria sp.]MDO5618166.1 Gfo/Idh/MocA family oxidoreductase [Kocuria sp.]